MDKTLLKIKILYDDMGKAEKRVADRILTNPKDILPLSITELADECGCGEATIVRFSRRLGLSGYQELKISIAREAGNTVINANMSSDDNAFEIFEKVCNDIYCSLERTKTVLDKNALEKAAEKIMSAGRIVVIGLGNSASVALDMSHKLLRTGYNAMAYSDNHMQMIACSQLTSNDVVIGISHSGSSKDVIEAMKTAKEHGAVTICITNRGKSPIVKCSDIVLFTASDETQYNILALNSRIAQLSIVDALYFYIVFKQPDHSLVSINETENSLKTKKF